MQKIIVIGGGPAGMMAAIAAASRGSSVIIMEKNERVGRKLAITGKGRCNLTSAVDKDQLIKGFPGNGRFLYSSLNEFSNLDLVEFFHRRGLKTKVERGKRVFPESDKAAHVVDILKNAMQAGQVEIMTQSAVTRLIIEEKQVVGIDWLKGRLMADAVIIATGGKSYPGTGSTGDGYIWAANAGHSIVEIRPGLVPLLAEEEWVKELQGLSLKNTRATAYDAEGGKINEDCGELLFTHYGLSGPIILSMSRDIALHLNNKGGLVRVELDLKPALSEEKLDERLQRDLNKYSRKIFKNALVDLLPGKMIPIIVNLSSIDEYKPCHQISRRERRGLVHLMKHLNLNIYGTRPIAEAIVTSGGVNTKEIDPKTMQSKLIKGLYFAGEVLDVDGYTGGYNLQAAFSTGYVAGKHASLS